MKLKGNCEAARKRVTTILGKLDEIKEKLRKCDQKRKQTICENTGDDAKEKVCKAAQKDWKQFNKIWVMKPKKNYMKHLRKGLKQFVKTLMFSLNSKKN